MLTSLASIVERDCQVSGDRVVWMRYDYTGSHVVTWTLKDGVLQLTDDAQDAYDPQVSGGRVVWETWQESLNGVATWTPSTGVTQITQEPQDAGDPHVSGDRIVWAAWDGTDFEIFAAAPGTSSSPAVTSLTPTSGPSAGGTRVTITGTNFMEGASVTFGGILATEVVVESPTVITCVSPEHSAGVVDVVVATSAGSSSVQGSVDDYTYVKDGPPATFGVVFVNGASSDAPEGYGEEYMEEVASNNLSKFYNDAKWWGYKTFMIRTTSKYDYIDDYTVYSRLPFLPNAKALANFLKVIKLDAGIEDVVIVAHSMGGLVSRAFIERVYDPNDSSYPNIVKLITIGTPHAGFHPFTEYSYFGKLTAFLQKIDFPIPGETLKAMTAAAMKEFNAESGRNSQIPYLLLGSRIQPHSYIGRQGVVVAWYLLWSELDTDGLVYTPSSQGIAPDYDVFLGGREVESWVIPGKLHGLTSKSVMSTLGITPDDTLTFDEAIFMDYVKPALEEAVATVTH
jgi:pimeloyl-ACP methyl ester carboxylesterase